MAEYRFPKSTEEKLYISADYSSETFENLTERAMDHFNMTKNEVMTDINLEIEQVQITGCLCHHDPSDWQSYFVLTRNNR